MKELRNVIWWSGPLWLLAAIFFRRLFELFEYHVRPEHHDIALDHQMHLGWSRGPTWMQPYYNFHKHPRTHLFWMPVGLVLLAISLLSISVALRALFVAAGGEIYQENLLWLAALGCFFVCPFLYFGRYCYRMGYERALHQQLRILTWRAAELGFSTRQSNGGSWPNNGVQRTRCARR